MANTDHVDSRDKIEARLMRRWPRLGMQDLADIALGQASLLECLMRRYDVGKEALEAEIVAFENATPPADLG